jgi:peptidoglycan/LPS O-acetylase OafA/YrhL
MKEGLLKLSPYTRISSLDSLRALSILLVLLDHFNVRVWNYSPPILLQFFFDGQLGVNIFFIISGFLITKHLATEYKHKQKILLRSFYTKRAFRILPIYYCLLSCYFVLSLLNFIHITNSSWLSSLLFFKYYNWQLDWETTHLWSLSVEENFYIIWALVLALCWSRKVIIACIIILFVLVSKIIYYYHPSFCKYPYIRTSC